MSFSKGTKFVILSQLHINEQYTLRRQLQIYLQQGFSRIYHNHEFYRIEDILEPNIEISQDESFLLIDRLSVSDDSDTLSRIYDSLETAFLKETEHADSYLSHHIFLMISLISLKQMEYVLKNLMIICSHLTPHLEPALFVKVSVMS